MRKLELQQKRHEARFRGEAVPRSMYASDMIESSHILSVTILQSFELPYTGRVADEIESRPDLHPTRASLSAALLCYTVTCKPCIG